MAKRGGGFPHWEVQFDEDGKETGTGAAKLLAEVPGEDLTDVFLFAHGWNNSRERARALFAGVFGRMGEVLRSPGVRPKGRAAIGTVGVVWPSMRWADEDAPGAAPAGPAAAVGGPARAGRAIPDRALVEALKAVYRGAPQRRAIKELADLIDRRPDDEAALDRFRDLMRPLVPAPEARPAPEADAPGAELFRRPAREVFTHVAATSPSAREGAADEGGAAGVFDSLQRAWDGALDVLRTATYWQMKERAGLVGRSGLGPLLGRLIRARPGLRLHLVGHSFGARLVAFSLAGLPAAALRGGSPVKSLALLQGAFSHFAFAERLRHDPGRSGALRGMASRVDGPILVTFSRLDTAVGDFYPLASLSAGDDSAAAGDLMDRWQGMGYDGAQNVDARVVPLGPVGTAYPVAPGRFLNLDGNDVIVDGGPPAGSHSDIVRPQIGWALLAGAGLV